jgi:hypothetical protein
MKLRLEKPGLVALDSRFVHPNFNPKAVSRLIRNHEAAMKAEMNAGLAAAQRDVDFRESVYDPDLFTVDRKKAATLEARVRKETEILAGEEPPQADTVKGHNPNFFPPFFNSFRSATVGGVVTTPRHRLDPANGLLSMSVAAFPPGGHIDRSAFMSALTIAPSTVMATISASAFVGGTIGAVTFLGFGRASARLLVSITADGPAGFRAASGSLLLGDQIFGVNRIPLTNMTAAARLLVNAGDLLLVSCGLRVTAGCGGLICSAASNVAISGAVLCLL